MHNRSYTTDTSADAHAVQLELLRRMPPAKRLSQALHWSDQLRRMAFAALERRYPNDSAEQIKLKFIELHYGKSLAEGVRQVLSKKGTAT